MNISFDLISDLHLSDDQFDWQGQATSQFCVVLGNVSANRDICKSALKKLAKCYVLVMFVDGNAEFAQDFHDVERSYLGFKKFLSGIPHLNYLYDNIIVLNNVAFIGANGWWNFDFGEPPDRHSVIDWYTSHAQQPVHVDRILEAAMNDVAYLLNSLEKLQHNNDIAKIVICTHTVPRLDLIEHDIELSASPAIHCMGNQWMHQITRVDVAKKIHTWVFGHYTQPVDRILNQVRYVNNAKGSESRILLPYYPKKIVID